MKTIKQIKYTLSVVLMALIAGTAQAAQVNFQLTGYVDYVGPANPFSLSTGDSIYASGTFDDSTLLSGTGVIDFSGAGNDMTITVGSMALTDEMDIFGGANLSLFMGDFDSLDYSTGDGTFDSFLDSFIGDGSLTGTWVTSSFEVTPVPLPAAVWLFGMGLLSLAGFARKRR
ncbi:MAG TPA: VPLPA-CTERM sorting domain-containing protein [Gammaproteobacteria bacterium]